MSIARVVHVVELQNARAQFQRLVENVRPALEEIVIRAQQDAGGDQVAFDFIDRLNEQRRRFEQFAEVVEAIVAQLDRDISNVERLKSAGIKS